MKVRQIPQKTPNTKYFCHSVQLETPASQMLGWIALRVTDDVFTHISAPCCTPAFGSGPVSLGAVQYIIIMFITYKRYAQLLGIPVGVRKCERRGVVVKGPA